MRRPSQIRYATILVATILLAVWPQISDAQDTTDDQKSDESKKPTLANGIGFRGFRIKFMMEEEYWKKEFEFSANQFEELENIEAKLYGIDRTKLNNANFKDLLKRERIRHNRQIVLPASVKNPNFLTPDEQRKLQTEARFKHYQEVHKALLPHQKRLLDQFLLWSYFSSSKKPFSQLIHKEALLHLSLSERRMNNLVEIVKQKERELAKAINDTNSKNAKRIFAKISDPQKAAYEALIDPERSYDEIKKLDFPPFSICTGGSWTQHRELQLTGEQMLTIPRIGSEFYKHLWKLREASGMSPIDYFNANPYYEIEVYNKEFADRINEFFRPSQFGTIEKQYIQDTVKYYGPTNAIFDTVIAYKVGLSKDEFKILKKLQREIKKEIQIEKEKLIRAGFEQIYETIDGTTRRRILKLFGEPPEFVLNRN